MNAIFRPGAKIVGELPLGAEVLGMRSTGDGRLVIATTAGAFVMNSEGIVNPINVTAYDPAERRAWAELDQFHQRPGGQIRVKIYAVQIEGSDRIHLVKAHTRAGAANYVRDQIKPTISARLPSQDELVAALQAGVEIEDATVTQENRS